MAEKRVCAVFFTGTETTKKIVTAIARELDPDYVEMDFSPLAARQKPLVFREDDLVIFGTPVIAGRVPNLLLKYLATIEGNGALAVPVVLFGNRNFDDALIELRDILENGGLHTIAAGAFVGEHSFSYTLAAGRPDEEDMKTAREFAAQIREKVAAGADTSKPIAVAGTPYPYRKYYTPRDRNGKGIDIRKVKPKTNDNCNDCKLCAEICPLGSIDYDDVTNVKGICMKCNACVKRCPQHAKYYDDEGYLYHQHELEAMYKRRADISLFI
ncbi:MAG: EFR1 family ferrodoxin [Anaerovoracaceae bacterium]|jgi:NAD-dependent dihydropyrimidine dehydrogenase PreA subunit/flavodoxin